MCLEVELLCTAWQEIYILVTEHWKSNIIMMYLGVFFMIHMPSDCSTVAFLPLCYLFFTSCVWVCVCVWYQHQAGNCTAAELVFSPPSMVFFLCLFMVVRDELRISWFLTVKCIQKFLQKPVDRHDKVIAHFLSFTETSLF